MASAHDYTQRAIQHLEAAQGTDDPEKQKQALRLALSYLRLAEMAQKNAGTDISYETPEPPVMQQQQIQPKPGASK